MIVNMLDKFLTYDILLLSLEGGFAYSTIDGLSLGARGGGT